MSRLVVKGGRVIDPSQNLDRIADVGIEDGTIREIADNIDAAGSDAFDASGLIVAPGFIDMHVHLREPGFEHSETIETGSRAAAAGGFTSICCMPNTEPVNDSATVTQLHPRTRSRARHRERLPNRRDHEEQRRSGTRGYCFHERSRHCGDLRRR